MNTIKLLQSVVVTTALLLPFSDVSAEPVDGRWIMEQVDARDDGDNMIADSVMILIDKNGNERLREMKIFSKDKGKDTLRMQFFHAPADVKDTGFLTYHYYSGEKDDDQWLYLPDLRKTKRIATSDKSSAFMGSDFSYADMTRRVVDEWNYKVLKEDEVEEILTGLETIHRRASGLSVFLDAYTNLYRTPEFKAEAVRLIFLPFATHLR